MTYAALLKSAPVLTHIGEAIHILSRALISKEPDALQDVVDRFDEGGYWPADLREDYQRLHDFRAFYTDEKLAEMPPEEQAAIKEYDWKWVLELAYRTFGFIPDELIGARPLPPEIKRLMPEPAPADSSEPIEEEREMAEAEITDEKSEPEPPEPHLQREAEAEPEPEPEL